MLKPGDLVRVGCDPHWGFDWQRKAAAQGVIFEIKNIYRRPDILMAQIKSPDGVAHWLHSRYLEPPF